MVRGREVGEVESGKYIITLKVTVDEKNTMKTRNFLEDIYNNPGFKNLHLKGVSIGIKVEPETIPKWLYDKQEKEKSDTKMNYNFFKDNNISEELFVKELQNQMRIIVEECISEVI